MRQIPSTPARPSAPGLAAGPLGRAAFLTLAAAGLVSCASASTESTEAVLQRASLAMGGTNLRSISFTGSGSGATFGQAFEPGAA